MTQVGRGSANVPTTSQPARPYTSTLSGLLVSRTAGWLVEEVPEEGGGVPKPLPDIHEPWNLRGRRGVDDGVKLRAAVLCVLTVLGLGLVASPAEPAWACSCVRPDQVDERADLIVVGTVKKVTDTGIELAVESVEKGSLRGAGTLGLRVGRHEANCGYDFSVNTRYRVNSIDGVTGLCAGIAVAPTPAQQPTPAQPPNPAQPPTRPATAPTSATAAPAPVRLPDRWWLATGAMLTVLAAGLVAVALRRHRSRASSDRTPKRPAGTDR